MIIAQRPFLSPIPACHPICFEYCVLVSDKNKILLESCSHLISTSLFERFVAAYLDTIDLAPSAHHETVVGSNDGHKIYALLQNLGQISNVRRQMTCLASRSESTRD